MHQARAWILLVLAAAACLAAGCSATPAKSVAVTEEPPAVRHPPPVVSRENPHAGALFEGKSLSTVPQLPPLDESSPKTVHIDAVRKIVEVGPGTRFRAETFGGQVPGPTVHVREGDTVKLSMTNRNESPEARASISVHGAMVASPDRFRAIAPGETLSFEFTASYPGVFLYHSATPMVLEKVAAGQFGALVVAPRQGWPTRADREYVVVQSELYARAENEDLFSLDPVTVRTGQVSYSLFNGRIYELVRHPLKARAGQRVRLYLLNAGPNKASSIEVEGLVFDRVYQDGNPENLRRGLQSVALAPGSGAVAELVIPEEGRYQLLDHSLNMSAEGAVGMIDASAGGEPPADVPPPRPPAGDVKGFQLFQRKCAVCHSTRLGVRVGWEGPNLAGVTKRRTEAWLVRWLQNPEGMLQTDPDARAMLEQYKYPMPAQNLSAAEIQSVLSYLRWIDR